MCSQTFFNLKYIQKLEMLYEFDVRLILTPKRGGSNCHVLPTIQKTHWPLLFIDNTLLAFYTNTTKQHLQK